MTKLTPTLACFAVGLSAFGPAAAPNLVEAASVCQSCIICRYGAPPTLSKRLADDQSIVVVSRLGPAITPFRGSASQSKAAVRPSFSVKAGDWKHLLETPQVPPSHDVFEVVEFLNGSAGLARGDRLHLPRSRERAPGRMFRLYPDHATDKTHDRTTPPWDAPVAISDAAIEYVRGLPDGDQPIAQRLRYVLNFLEHPDPLVAHDVWQELSMAPFNDLARLAARFPRDLLRMRVFGDGTDHSRRGLYGAMLGQCGNVEDVKLLEQLVTGPEEEFRLGVDGILAGYLLLAGEQGLNLIDRTRLANPEAAVVELFAAMSALRIVWEHDGGSISRERLRESMRRLFDREEVVDLVIANLARWQDWSVLDRIVDLYDCDGFEDTASHRTVKRAVIGYLLSCAKDTTTEPGGMRDRITTAKDHLARLRVIDADLVRHAERFLFNP